MSPDVDPSGEALPSSGGGDHSLRLLDVALPEMPSYRRVYVDSALVSGVGGSWSCLVPDSEFPLFLLEVWGQKVLRAITLTGNMKRFGFAAVRPNHEQEVMRTRARSDPSESML